MKPADFSLEAIYARTAPGGSDGECRIWQLSCNNVGVPQLMVGRTCRSVRSWMAELHGMREDLATSGRRLIAMCGHDRCVRWDHLRAADPREIAQRDILTGRKRALTRDQHARMVTNRRARGTKLTAKIAREIYASTEPQSTLAKRYDVDQRLVYGIKRGEVWKEAAAPVPVTMCPSGSDARFTFIPPPGWVGEITRDWLARRASRGDAPTGGAAMESD